ncbi:MAG: fchA [candidate division NC10 bacterium]|nr:fchA [candidate division NC10 bacterium]
MPTRKTLPAFLDELASSSPAPGGGSVAALAGALGAGLTAMVCNLTIGKKRYAEVEGEMKAVLAQAEGLRAQFTELIDRDTAAFNKVMEAFGLPKETEPQKALRAAACRVFCGRAERQGQSEVASGSRIRGVEDGRGGFDPEDKRDDARRDSVGC